MTDLHWLTVSEAADLLGKRELSSVDLTKAAFERIVAACRKHNKIPGIGGLAGSDTKNYEYAIKLGARFMSAGNEWSLMMAAGKERVKAIRSLHTV